MTARDPLMTPAEVESYTRFTVKTLAQWRCQRRGPEYIKVNGRVLYRLSVIDAYLKTHTVKTAS